MTADRKNSGHIPTARRTSAKQTILTDQHDREGTTTNRRKGH